MKNNTTPHTLVIGDSMVRYQETRYGFDFGSLSITRTLSDEKKGHVVISINTPKTELHIYATKTGKVRILDYKSGLELKPSSPKKKEIKERFDTID